MTPWPVVLLAAVAVGGTLAVGLSDATTPPALIPRAVLLDSVGGRQAADVRPMALRADAPREPYAQWVPRTLCAAHPVARAVEMDYGPEFPRDTVRCARP